MRFNVDSYTNEMKIACTHFISHFQPNISKFRTMKYRKFLPVTWLTQCCQQISYFWWELKRDEERETEGVSELWAYLFILNNFMFCGRNSPRNFQRCSHLSKSSADSRMNLLHNFFHRKTQSFRWKMGNNIPYNRFTTGVKLIFLSSTKRWNNSGWKSN